MISPNNSKQGKGGDDLSVFQCSYYAMLLLPLTAAPEDMPQSTPSLVASTFAVSMAAWEEICTTSSSNARYTHHAGRQAGRHAGKKATEERQRGSEKKMGDGEDERGREWQVVT